MALKPADYATIDTTSPRKIQIINKQIRIANYNFPDTTALKGLCIGLPGAGSQCERHRDEYRSYGIPDERQVMVDYNHEVHISQVNAMKKLRYAGKIVCDSIMNVVENKWNNNETIDIIDYDGVSYMLEEHEQAIKLAGKNDVKIFNLVMTSRCNMMTDCHERWKKELKLKAYRNRYGNLAQPIRNIQVGAVTNIAQKAGFNVFWEAYRGHGSPMVAFFLINKKFANKPK